MDKTHLSIKEKMKAAPASNESIHQAVVPTNVRGNFKSNVQLILSEYLQALSNTQLYTLQGHVIVHWSLL